MRSDEEERAVCESSESSWEVEERLSPVKRKIRDNVQQELMLKLQQTF